VGSAICQRSSNVRTLSREDISTRPRDKHHMFLLGTACAILHREQWFEFDFSNKLNVGTGSDGQIHSYFGLTSVDAVHPSGNIHPRGSEPWTRHGWNGRDQPRRVHGQV